MKTYITWSKGDDYGKSLTELVETTEEKSAEYYDAIEVAKEDVEILKKYFDIVPFEKESERNSSDRYYGTEITE